MKQDLAPLNQAPVADLITALAALGWTPAKNQSAFDKAELHQFDNNGLTLRIVLAEPERTGFGAFVFGRNADGLRLCIALCRLLGSSLHWDETPFGEMRSAATPARLFGCPSLTPAPENEDIEMTVSINGVEFVEVRCTSPACRGKQNGGRGFKVMVQKGREATAQCNECFSR